MGQSDLARARFACRLRRSSAQRCDTRIHHRGATHQRTADFSTIYADTSSANGDDPITDTGADAPRADRAASHANVAGAGRAAHARLRCESQCHTVTDGRALLQAQYARARLTA